LNNPGHRILWASQPYSLFHIAFFTWFGTAVPNPEVTMANVLQYIPDADGDEIAYLNMIVQPLTDQQAAQFAMMYRARRKDPQMILILAIVGFLGIAGIHRLIIGNIGLGILYVLTGGLCGIGTIVDIVNYKKLASGYNQQQAYEVANIMRSMGQL